MSGGQDYKRLVLCLMSRLFEEFTVMFVIYKSQSINSSVQKEVFSQSVCHLYKGTHLMSKQQQASKTTIKISALASFPPGIHIHACSHLAFLCWSLELRFTLLLLTMRPLHTLWMSLHPFFSALRHVWNILQVLPCCGWQKTLGGSTTQTCDEDTQWTRQVR